MSDTESVQQELASLIKTRLRGPRSFSSGAKGFHGTDKITTSDGTRYQAHAQAVLIGSKGNAKVRVTANLDQVRAALTAFVEEAGVKPVQFKSGNDGFRTQAKLEIGGQRYQAQVQAVRLK